MTGQTVKFYLDTYLQQWLKEYHFNKVTYSNLFKLLHLGKYERHLPLIGVWRNWLAHFPDKEEVECSSHSVDTKINKL